jgi:hypothetical protein
LKTWQWTTGAFAAVAVIILVLIFGLTTTTCGCGVSNPSEIYSPCITGYSGFLAPPTKDPNSSTTDFTIAKGSTAYLVIRDNVSKGLDLFLEMINGSWTIWQNLNSTTFLLFYMNGSTIAQLTYNVMNQFPVDENPRSYTAGVFVILRNYTVSSTDIVTSVWSVQGNELGNFQAETSAFTWITFIVSPPSNNSTTSSTISTGSNSQFTSNTSCGEMPYRVGG